MSSLQAFYIFIPLAFVVAFLGAIIAIALLMKKLQGQSRAFERIAAENNYGFWSGYPKMAGRYPESQLFLDDTYVLGCFVNVDGAEFGVTSFHQRYVTKLIKNDITGSLYIDALGDNDRPSNGFKFEDYLSDGRNGVDLPVKLEEITLEGNFNRYFKVFQPVGQQINSLSLLSPNAMAKLIDIYGRCNIEISNGRITILMAPDDTSKTALLNTHYVAEQFKLANDIENLFE